MTPFQQHLENWRNCQACALCQERRHVVLYRGDLPCQVLFIGEGPGNSEDDLAQPFIGPAGKYFNEIIVEALNEAEIPACINKETGSIETSVRLGFTNIIACIPEKTEDGKPGEPPKFAIEACAGRLREIVSIAKPQVLVLTGGHAMKWTKKQLLDDLKPKSKLSKVPSKAISLKGKQFIEIVHPSAILQAQVASQGLMYQRVVSTLSQDVFSQF